MDTATIQWIISLALCIIAWFFPNLAWYWKVIITLGITLLSLFISWFRLNRNYRKLQRAKQDIENNISYVDLMKQNLENLKLTLNG